MTYQWNNLKNYVQLFIYFLFAALFFYFVVDAKTDFKAKQIQVNISVDIHIS